MHTAARADRLRQRALPDGDIPSANRETLRVQKSTPQDLEDGAKDAGNRGSSVPSERAK